MPGTIRTSRARHLRHRRLDGIDRGAEGAVKDSPRLKRFAAWLDARADTAANGGIGDTAVTDAFTANATGVAATGILTLTGQPLDTQTVVIDGKTYIFQTTLTDVDGNVVIGANASESLDNLIAAIDLGTRQIAATGILTFTGNAVDTQVVVLGGTTYTFQTSLVDSANNVLIGATASDSIDNLIAAITAGAGVGTLYGTGTVANTDATAAAGAGDTMDATALTLGLAGNSVTTTETQTNASWGAVTLEGGVDVYAVSTTELTTVTAAAGAGDTMDLTAATAGLAGNSIATTETLDDGSFGAVTLEGGEDGDTLDAAAHGLTTGDGPFVLTTTGTLPAGLALLTLYWARAIDVDNLALYRLKESAVRDENRIDVTDAGSGTQTFARAADVPGLIEWLRQDNDPDTIQALTDIDAL